MTVAYDERADQIVMFGGYDGRFENDTWTWDGAEWSVAKPSTPPPARTGAVMAYDSARDETVLFGGLGITEIDDTWTFSDGEWVEQHPAHSPLARQDSVMAWDPNSQQLILFGGTNSPKRGKLGDTWAWNGSDWTELSPRHSPPGRGEAALAYDKGRDALILFGGRRGKEFRNDTWSWDGHAWSQVSVPLSPRRMSSSAMATFGRSVVLFGGYFGQLERDGETWKLGKKTWEKLDLEPAPEPRNDAGMVWDSLRERAVLFGGYAGNRKLRDTWTLTER